MLLELLARHLREWFEVPEVVLCRDNGDMTHLGGERWQLCLDVYASAVPTE